MKSRTIFEIEAKDNELTYSFHKDVKISNGSIMFLLGSMFYLMLSNGSGKNDVSEITERVAASLKNSSEFIHCNYKYTYKEDSMSGFSESIVASISQIARVLYSCTSFSDEVDLLDFVKRSIEFYGYLHGSDITASDWFFLTDEEFIEKHEELIGSV